MSALLILALESLGQCFGASFFFTRTHTYLRNRDMKRRCKLLTFDVTAMPMGAICLRRILKNVIFFCVFERLATVLRK